jgi:hypothetical protein
LSILIITIFKKNLEMSLLSRISIKELVKKYKELKIKEYGSKQVILTRLEKRFFDNELGAFNLKEYIQELHPSNVHTTPHSSPTHSTQTSPHSSPTHSTQTSPHPSPCSSNNQPESVGSVVINDEEETEESEEENGEVCIGAKKV